MAEEKKHKVGQTGWKGTKKYRWNGSKWEEVEPSLAELAARNKKVKGEAESTEAESTKPKRPIAAPPPGAAAAQKEGVSGGPQTGDTKKDKAGNTYVFKDGRWQLRP